MSITSFGFLFLIAIGVIIYYVIPKKLQWVELLLLSAVFYYFAAVPLTVLYLVAVTLIAYLSTIFIQRIRSKNPKSKVPFILTIISIGTVLFIWFAVKGKGLWYPIAERVLNKLNPLYLERLDAVQIIAALGMGYFTLQILGYIIDCYWENIIPQKNPLKLFLFVAYFPQLTTGPISRYSQLESLYLPHKFDYEKICFGAQRILWGFFKKIVIAERVGVLINGIIGNPAEFHGFYSWMVLLLYPLQMYADFSGCMDIVIGVSELFDINLPENFNNPFFARTSQEFWQRWHMTLGTWAKDYVLYPMLKSGPMVRFGKFTKKKFGKTFGGFLKNCVGMFVLWMVMGIWHGGYRYIIGVSLWYWIILMLGNIFSGIFEKISAKLKFKTESFSWHLFTSIRTYVIYAIGAVFFLNGILGGLRLLKDCLKVFFVSKYANPWIFFDSSILKTGITFRDINIILIGIILLLIVGVLREKYGYAREWIKNQSFVFRWIIWFSLFVAVLIYGMYGQGYEASAFIYQGF